MSPKGKAHPITTRQRPIQEVCEESDETGAIFLKGTSKNLAPASSTFYTAPPGACLSFGHTSLLLSWILRSLRRKSDMSRRRPISALRRAHACGRQVFWPNESHVCHPFEVLQSTLRRTLSVLDLLTLAQRGNLFFNSPKPFPGLISSTWIECTSVASITSAGARSMRAPGLEVLCRSGSIRPWAAKGL